MNAKRVKLEPILEERACLWAPAKRRLMASLYERWARQLRISAAILERDCMPKPRGLVRLPKRKLSLN